MKTLHLYALALHLYPAAFRARYADEMLDTARHEFALSPNPFRFTASLAADTLRGALREHLRAASPTRPAYVAAFALFFTFLLIPVSIVNQQILRRSADRLPTFLTHILSTPMPDAHSEAVRKRFIADIMTPEDTADIASPSFLNGKLVFTAFYDASGHPIGGNATLHGALPRPPHGIFNTIQQRGEFKVTWQPQPNIRVALAGRPMPNGGFVLSGQSLLPTEAHYIRMHTLLLWIWAFTMLTCLALVLFTRRPRTA
jgi:hypothetical protein